MSNESEINYTTLLKHRLIGAGILISFAVIFLPWILGSYSSEQTESKRATLQNENNLPGAAEVLAGIDGTDADRSEVKVFVSRVQPLDGSSDLSEPENKAASKEPTPAVKKTSSPKKEAKPEPNAAPKPKIKDKPKVIDNGYIVSVGVFGNTANVEKMKSDLSAKGFKPSVRKEKLNNKSVSRIFMGPFATRAEAGRIKLRLSEKENIPSLIKAFP